MRPNLASDCSKSVIKQKNGNDVKICRHDVIMKVFGCCFGSFVKFSYWSKFHVNIIAGFAGVMTIFFYKGLIRNPEIRNEYEFCPISGDWGELNWHECF